MIGEVEEGRAGSPPFSLEEQRDERREADQRRRDAQPPRREQRRRALAQRAIADVVVILAEDDEAAGRQPDGRPAVAPLPRDRLAPFIDVGVPPGVRHIGQRAKVGVVAVALAGQRGV